jgi:hypothetical protein
MATMGAKDSKNSFQEVNQEVNHAQAPILAPSLLMNPLIFAGTHIGPISWRMTGLNNPV